MSIINGEVFPWDHFKRGQLLLAAGNKPPHALEALLNGPYREKVDEKDYSGRTALSWAAEAGRADNVKIILKYGADLDQQDNNGRSPLSWAAEGGDLRTTELLIARGANVNLKDSSGLTPLTYTHKARHSNTRAMKRLLQDHGASRLKQIWLNDLKLIWSNIIGTSKKIRRHLDGFLIG
ncbi:hypothetical protein PRK78_006576 [Emydomyces testavorans]|uniref:Ankyrin repeat domain-containing protein n=1 Tax=Emydomyces testavorans TaxID=2070801 RepID=A0AAF0DNQ7_9EURO|nr:hypothetical protein PRK78_006576 [Emydomyces testavorans]